MSLRFVEGATDEGLIGLIKSCGQSLLSLGIANCAWMTDASLRAVGSHCPNLEILSLESELVKNEGVISIAKGCRLLKNLKLQCIGAGDEALEAIGSCCSLLEILSLNNFERFTDRYSVYFHFNLLRHKLHFCFNMFLLLFIKYLFGLSKIFCYPLCDSQFDECYIVGVAEVLY